MKDVFFYNQNKILTLKNKSYFLHKSQKLTFTLKKIFYYIFIVKSKVVKLTKNIVN